MTVYVVFGSTGEYSDRSEWPVVAYVNEADAKTHVERATEYAKAWHAFSHSDEFDKIPWGEQRAREKAANPLDPTFSCDYTGTTYWYAPIEVRDGFTSPEQIQ